MVFKKAMAAIDAAHQEARLYRRAHISGVYASKLLAETYSPRKENKMVSKIVEENHAFKVLTRGKIRNPESTNALVSTIKSEFLSFRLLTARNGWTSSQYYSIRSNIKNEKLVKELSKSSMHGEFLG